MRLQPSLNATHEYSRVKKELFFFLFGCVRPDLAVLNLIRDWLELWVQRGHGLGQKGQEVSAREKASGTAAT